MGAYSESKGVRFIREAVARFISQRDGIPADPEAIYLTDGASKGVQAALRVLIGAPSDGIMIPIPQYPLYSATITLYEGRQVNFYMDEANDWKLSQAMLESSLREAEGAGRQGARHLRHQPGQPHRLGHGLGQHRHGHPLRQGARPGHPGRRGLPGERLPARRPVRLLRQGARPSWTRRTSACSASTPAPRATWASAASAAATWRSATSPPTWWPRSSSCRA